VNIKKRLPVGTAVLVAAEEAGEVFTVIGHNLFDQTVKIEPISGTGEVLRIAAADVRVAP